MTPTKSVVYGVLPGLLLLWSGCGSGGDGGPAAVPIVTSITVSGTCTEPSVVSGTAITDDGATAVLNDSDLRPSLWSVTFIPEAGDTAVTVQAVDGADNERVYRANVSLP